jgi:hypothetical protein
MSHKKGGVIISPNESAIGSGKGGAGVYDGVKGYPPRSPGAGGPPEKVIDGNVGGPKPPSKQSY